MPMPISGDEATERPIDTAQLQTSTEQLQTCITAIPTDTAVGDEDKHPKSSPLYFPPSEPFESEDENQIPTVSIAMSGPHHSERGTVAAVTSARKTKYSRHKKSGTNITQRQPSRVVPKKQAIATGKRLFVERKIVKYRVKVDSPGSEIIQLYQLDKF